MAPFAAEIAACWGNPTRAATVEKRTTEPGLAAPPAVRADEAAFTARAAPRKFRAKASEKSFALVDFIGLSGIDPIA
jgi:hypothetical protein